MIDFGVEKTFDAIRLYATGVNNVTSKNFPKTIFVDTSSDGTNFITIAEKRNLPAFSPLQSIEIEFDRIKTRFVRFSNLRLDGLNGPNGVVSIGEIEFHMATEQ